MSARKSDPFADTLVLPEDELAIRRARKRAGQLTLSQIQRLVVAAELRRKATECEREEDWRDYSDSPLPINIPANDDTAFLVDAALKLNTEGRATVR